MEEWKAQIKLLRRTSPPYAYTEMKKRPKSIFTRRQRRWSNDSDINNYRFGFDQKTIVLIVGISFCFLFFSLSMMSTKRATQNNENEGKLSNRLDHINQIFHSSAKSAFDKRTCIEQDYGTCFPIKCDGNTTTTEYFYDGLIERNVSIQRRPMTSASLCVESRKYKFAYVQIPESGSDDPIEEALKQCLCGSYGECVEEVFEYKRCDHVFADDSFFFFSFVRNPFTRMASVYHQMNKSEGSFKQFVDETELKMQNEFILSADDLCPTVDFVAKLENWNHDLPFIMKHIWKKSNEQFPIDECLRSFHFLNTFDKDSFEQEMSGKKIWKDFYENDGETQKIVRDLFADDFVAFGYRKDIDFSIIIPTDPTVI